MNRFLLALLWGLLLVGGAQAQNLPAFTQFAGCITTLDPTFATGGFGRLRCNADGSLYGSGGGGGGGGSVTAAGTNGTLAQAVQGIQGGVPQNSFVGQYNSTLPTMASGASGYIQTDVNGRLITTISNVPFVQGSTANGAAVSGLPVRIAGSDGTNVRDIRTTTTGALEPPTAASGKIVQTSVSLAATTSTTLVAANTARIAVEIQCDGTAAVGVDRTGAALTSATAAPLVIPSGSFPLYTMPIASLTAITAYTGTAQTCRVTEYNR